MWMLAVPLEYQADERHLVFDSPLGDASARFYTHEPYDVAVYGLVKRFRFFLR
jgi:hypothetical protein